MLGEGSSRQILSQPNETSMDYYDTLENYFDPLCFIKQEKYLDILYLDDSQEKQISQVYQQNFIKQVENVNKKKLFNFCQLEKHSDALNQLKNRQKLSIGQMYIRKLEKNNEKIQQQILNKVEVKLDGISPDDYQSGKKGSYFSGNHCSTVPDLDGFYENYTSTQRQMSQNSITYNNSSRTSLLRRKEGILFEQDSKSTCDNLQGQIELISQSYQQQLQSYNQALQTHSIPSATPSKRFYSQNTSQIVSQPNLSQQISSYTSFSYKNSSPLKTKPSQSSSQYKSQQLNEQNELNFPLHKKITNNGTYHAKPKTATPGSQLSHSQLKANYKVLREAKREGSLANSQSVSSMQAVINDISSQDFLAYQVPLTYSSNILMNTNSNNSNNIPYTKSDNQHQLHKSASQNYLSTISPNQFPYQHARMLIQHQQSQYPIQLQQQFQSCELPSSQQTPVESQPVILNKNAKSFAKIFKSYQKQDFSSSPTKIFAEYVPSLTLRRHQRKYIPSSNVITSVLKTEESEPVEKDRRIKVGNLRQNALQTEM